MRGEVCVLCCKQYLCIILSHFYYLHHIFSSCLNFILEGGFPFSRHEHTHVHNTHGHTHFNKLLSRFSSFEKSLLKTCTPRLRHTFDLFDSFDWQFSKQLQEFLFQIGVWKILINQWSAWCCCLHQVATVQVCNVKCIMLTVTWFSQLSERKSSPRRSDGIGFCFVIVLFHLDFPICHPRNISERQPFDTCNDTKKNKKRGGGASGVCGLDWSHAVCSRNQTARAQQRLPPSKRRREHVSV